jgi:peroxiredoxin
VPAATVQTADGKYVQLTELTSAKPSVIIFDRGGWCPDCTRHLAGLGEIEPQLKARGYQILALSTDNAAHAAATNADLEVGYQPKSY